MIGPARLLLILALLLSACGPVPAPFKQPPQAKAENPLLALPESAGVTVAPPAEGPSALTGPLAERTAERLRWAGVPASTGPALTGGYLLEGEAGWADDMARVAWRLTDRRGTIVAEPAAEAPASRADFEAGTDALIAPLAEASAAAVADALRPPALRRAEAGAAVAEAPRTVYLLGVDGPAEAPAAELARALSALLDELQVPRAERAEEAGLLIQGSLAAAASGADGGAAAESALAIDWYLMDPEGAVIGTLNQRNSLTGDPLADGFGPAAYDIAYPVAEAIRDALGRPRR